jgi:multidrug transporter EmrE-like cation transporter
VFIVLSVSLSAAAQVLLKAGMSRPSVLAALAGGNHAHAAAAIATSAWVVGGLTLYFASAAVWLLVLARIPVSAAYPFVGLGFVLTMLFGWLALGENLSAMRVAGTLLVAAGVVVIARSI